MDVPGCLRLPDSGFCLFGLSHDVYCSTTVSGFFVMVISWHSDRCFVMMTAGGCLRNPVGDKRPVGYIKCVISDTLVLSNRTWRNREPLITPSSDDNHRVNECKACLAGNPHPEATSDVRAHKSDLNVGWGSFLVSDRSARRFSGGVVQAAGLKIRMCSAAVFCTLLRRGRSEQTRDWPTKTLSVAQHVLSRFLNSTAFRPWDAVTWII